VLASWHLLHNRGQSGRRCGTRAGASDVATRFIEAQWPASAVGIAAHDVQIAVHRGVRVDVAVRPCGSSRWRAALQCIRHERAGVRSASTLQKIAARHIRPDDRPGLT